MKSRFVIGSGAMLDIAVDAWSHAQPDERIVRVEISQKPDYGFDLSPLDAVDRDAAVFIAFDERFGNFSRLDLFQAAIERGLRMPPYVSSRAMLASSAKVGPNTFVGDGVVIGARSIVDHNCVVNAGVMVGSKVRVKPSCWLATGVILGNDVEVGGHSTLRMGVIVADRTKIGRNCELGVTGHYREDVAARTVFDARYDAPIFVYGS